MGLIVPYPPGRRHTTRQLSKENFTTPETRGKQLLPCAPLTTSSCILLRKTSYGKGMDESLQLTIWYQPGEQEWVLASIPEVPGAMSQGRTREEARGNVIDALRLMLKPEPTGTLGDREQLKLTIAS